VFIDLLQPSVVLISLTI